MKTKKKLPSEMIEHINLSIQKWEEILNDGGEDRLSNNCALCQNYTCHEDWEEDKDFCPLLLAGDCCDSILSTWTLWSHHQQECHPEEKADKVHDACCKPYAEDMLKVLKNLLKDISWYK